jgi:hypothetical protein
LVRGGFISLPDAKTDCGVNLIPYPIGKPPGISTRRLKKPVHEATNILHPVSSAGMNGILKLLSLRVFMKFISTSKIVPVRN